MSRFSFEEDNMISGGGSYFEGGRIYTKCKISFKPTKNSMDVLFTQGESEMTHKIFYPRKTDTVPQDRQGKFTQKEWYDYRVKRFNRNLLTLLTGLGFKWEDIKADIKADTLKDFIKMITLLANKRAKTTPINFKTVFNNKGYVSLGYDNPIEVYIEGEPATLGFTEYELKAIQENRDKLRKKKLTKKTNDDDEDFSDINDDEDDFDEDDFDGEFDEEFD